MKNEENKESTNSMSEEKYNNSRKQSEIKQKKPKNYCKSKWANLKYILQDKESLESSVKLLKRKTIEQFSSKCQEIYKTKILIHLITEKNKKMFSAVKSKETIDEDILQKINIKEDLSDLPTDLIKDFFFLFREDNKLMYNLIEKCDDKDAEILVPFLCHFFYENFFMESTEQEEMLYIIYLLLEKEINSLCTPSPITFLSNSFLSKFLIEFANRYEIKHYIDIVLNNLIRDVEELNLSFYSLNILLVSNAQIENSKNKNKNINKDLICIDMDLERMEDDFRSRGNSTSMLDLFNIKNDIFSQSQNYDMNHAKRKSTIIKPNKNLKININSAMLNNNKIIYDNKIFKNIINKNFFNVINRNYLKKSLEKESNEIMKQFYMKQLKKMQSLKNENLYNTNTYYKKLKDQKTITKDSIEYYNKAYDLITNFLDKLLDNLENATIIPYSIKAICKIIFLLLQKRFKKISGFQINLLICRFLFDKLILPVLQNPDLNDTSKDKIISLSSRKNIYNIYTVLKTFIRGELFNSRESENLTIFNKYIIDNYNRVNKIIQKIIQVKIPEKLLILTDEFNENSQKNLYLKTSKDISYEYFAENPNDFMQHKSICFTTEHFFLFYDIVKQNKDKFFKPNTQQEKIFETISNFISMIENKPYDYYVIINDIYNDEIKELLFSTEKKYGLGRLKSDKLNNIKYSITHLLSNLKILPHWKWVNDANYQTFDIFNFINKFLNIYEEHIFSTQPPLNWYSLYIIKNIHSIDENYSNNDYQKLYDEIEDDILQRIEKLKKLNDFLTVNIGTKFSLIKKKIKIFEQELENVQSTEVTLKTSKFMELTPIKVCLIDEIEYNNIQKKLSKDVAQPIILNKSLIISWQENCEHKKLRANEFKSLEESGHISKFHFKNIKQFSKKFKDFYQSISDEIINRSLGVEFEKVEYNLNTDTPKNEIKNTLHFKLEKAVNMDNQITISPKNILDQYMMFVSLKINKSKFFNSSNLDNKFTFIGNEDNNSEEIDFYKTKTNNIYKFDIHEKEEKDKAKAKKIIWNYILKALCIKIYEEPALIIDKAFKLKCISFRWIKPKNLQICDDVCNEVLFDKIRYHIKRIDQFRTPRGMIDEFSKAVQLIQNLFVFLLDNKNAEAGEILPIIIYCIISAFPERIIFNINFVKFFLDDSDLRGGMGYNVIQAESSINFIQKIVAKQLGISQEEFNNNCMKKFIQ